MSSPVAIINGVQIFSDKQLSGVTNTKVQFSDGSHADVRTGEVVNRGAGYISLGNPPKGASGARQKPQSRSEQFRRATAVRISDLNAETSIEPHDGSGVEVQITGPQDAVDAVGISESGGLVTISDGGSGSGLNLVADVLRGSSVRVGGSISIVTGSGSVSIGGGSRSELRVQVKVPRGAPVTLQAPRGNVQIGHTEGPLTATLQGSGKLRCGRVGSTSLTVQGSAKVKIDEVRGDRLDVVCQGSARVKVRDGRVRALTVQSQGSADVTFDGHTDRANLSATGSGDVDVEHVAERPLISTAGSASVRVGNW